MILVRFGQREARPPALCSYRVAGHSLVSDQPIAELAPFAAKGPDRAPPSWSGSREPGARKSRRVYRGQGWIGNAWRDVVCWQDGTAYRLFVDEAGEFSIAAEDGGTCLVVESVQDEAGLAQALLGPGLILALALHGVWALHASAIVREGEALAFLAESGVGKSTLAFALCDDTCSGYRLLADDVLPISLAEDGARAWPHFPQLKLDRTAQPGLSAPESLPLDVCYLLQLGGEGLADRRAESVHEATLAFVRHTIAARLFGPDLLGRHLRFCEALARRVPLYRLAYSHSRGALAEARRLVTGEHSACSVLLGSA